MVAVNGNDNFFKNYNSGIDTTKGVDKNKISEKAESNVSQTSQQLQEGLSNFSGNENAPVDSFVKNTSATKPDAKPDKKPDKKPTEKPDMKPDEKKEIKPEGIATGDTNGSNSLGNSAGNVNSDTGNSYATADAAGSSNADSKGQGMDLSQKSLSELVQMANDAEGQYKGKITGAIQEKIASNKNENQDTPDYAKAIELLGKENKLG